MGTHRVTGRRVGPDPWPKGARGAAAVTSQIRRSPARTTASAKGPLRCDDHDLGGSSGDSFDLCPERLEQFVRDGRLHIALNHDLSTRRLAGEGDLGAIDLHSEVAPAINLTSIPPMRQENLGET